MAGSSARLDLSEPGRGVSETPLRRTKERSPRKREWPADRVLADKAWRKLFDPANEYQALIIEFIDAGGEFPIAGTGFHCTMRMRRAAASSRETESDAYNTQALALTIAKMHGRETRARCRARPSTCITGSSTTPMPGARRHLDRRHDRAARCAGRRGGAAAGMAWTGGLDPGVRPRRRNGDAQAGSGYEQRT